MVLEHIDIFNFKNIAEASVSFSPGVNCFLGRNGMGKSNMLEAVHFLSLAKGMSSMPESGFIRHGENFFMLKGDYLSDAGSRDQVACSVTAGKGKTVKANGKEYPRISAHIGRFPVVLASPADNSIVSGAAQLRRRLMDMAISQANQSYLSRLITYQRALTSRNTMLKNKMNDPLLYESLEATMGEAAAEINRTRKEWVKEISPIVTDIYSKIAGVDETCTLEYESDLNDSDSQTLFDASRGKDLALGYTTTGVHRDDLVTSLSGHSLRHLGSQGQVKTFTIAMRLAMFRHLKEKTGITPLLLLDDIFDKLDASRVENIMTLVTSDLLFGQIFITDTNRDHLDQILSLLQADKSLWEVENGNLKPLSDA